MLKKWIEHYEQLLAENKKEYTSISPSEILIEGEEVNIDTATQRAVD